MSNSTRVMTVLGCFYIAVLMFVPGLPIIRIFIALLVLAVLAIVARWLDKQ